LNEFRHTAKINNGNIPKKHFTIHHNTTEESDQRAPGEEVSRTAGGMLEVAMEKSNLLPILHWMQEGDK